MARLHKSRPTAEVHAEWWETGETVTLRTFLSGYDRAYLRSQLEAQPTGAPAAALDATVVALELCIAGWTFCYDPEEGGGPIPVTQETIRGLDDADFAYLVREMNTHLAQWQRAADAPELTEAERKKARFRRGKDPAAGLPGQAESGGDPTGVGGEHAPVSVS